MNYEEFIQRQNSIYSAINAEAKDLLRKGTVPNQNLIEGEKGYLIGLKHPVDISKEVEKISKKISLLLPAMVYKSEDVHTTIFSQKIEFDSDFDSGYLSKLSKVIGNLRVKKVEIKFNKYLYNQNAVIAAGHPNKDFFHLAQEIMYSLNEKGVEASLPKMAHVTVSRFMEKVNSGEITAFKKLMNLISGPGTSLPNTLFVGGFTATVKGFDLEVFEEHRIRKEN